MLRTAVITLFFIALSLPAQAQQSVHSIDVSGKIRWLTLVKPPRAKSGAPLVILLHGGTSSMTKTLKWPNGRDWQRLARNKGFVLLAPNGTQAHGSNPKGNRQHWNDHREPNLARSSDADDVAFIRALINWAAAKHGINENRVYVTGASNGGMMTYRLLLEAPELFRAGAAFIANLPRATPQMRQSKPVPLLIANATNDPLTRWEGGKIGARGQQDYVLSTPATLNFWLKRNRARAKPSTSRTLPDRTPEDGCTLKIADHPARPGGAPVRFIKMEGSGHTVPSRSGRVPQGKLEKRILGQRCYDANGADLVWQFFVQQR